MIYEAVGHIGVLKMTSGWLFCSGNIVILVLRKNATFFQSSVEKNYHGKYFFDVLQKNRVTLVLSGNDEI